MRIAQAPTACAAFHAHRDSGKACHQGQNIINFISRMGGDWSIGELAEAMGLQKSTISARVRELLDEGQLDAMPKRKDRVSLITVRPVGLPRWQMGLFQ
jgi:DNA-binding transcriptional ArsR family regulator